MAVIPLPVLNAVELVDRVAAGEVVFVLVTEVGSTRQQGGRLSFWNLFARS